jgi:DNA-directed RNA polymerase specialized sigma24 family protein
MIEARIARWQANGEDDIAVRREIKNIMESQERSLAQLCGRQIARDVIDDHAEIVRIIGERFDATRPLRPWLRTVLTRRCWDLDRSQNRNRKNNEEPCELNLDRALENEAEQRYFDAELEKDSAPSLGEIAADIGLFINRRLKRPDRRLIFVGAVGLAHFLQRELLDEWCHDSGREQAIAEEIIKISAAKPHGRLTKLAEVLGLKENTVRQNFKRAGEELQRHGEHPQIEKLIKLLRKRRS